MKKMIQTIGTILMVALFSVPVVAQGPGGVQEVFETNWLSLALMVLILVLIIGIVYLARLSNQNVPVTAYQSYVDSIDKMLDKFINDLRGAARLSPTPLDDPAVELGAAAKEFLEARLREFLNLPQDSEIGETPVDLHTVTSSAQGVTIKTPKGEVIIEADNGPITFPRTDEADTKTPLPEQPES